MYIAILQIFCSLDSSSQWGSYTRAHWGTGLTISLCGPTIKILAYHVIQLI